MENSTSVCTTLGDRTSNLAKIGRSEAEGWGMGNGEWGMGNGEWGIFDSQRFPPIKKLIPSNSCNWQKNC
ncbi:hypothetical protein [Microcoleus sp. S11D4]|uniref:hypothetical protein n=1 Tax=Microcoleus sp. S11D4 TaxID=3055407 RepID=UPI002FD467C7